MKRVHPFAMPYIYVSEPMFWKAPKLKVSICKTNKQTKENNNNKKKPPKPTGHSSLLQDTNRSAMAALLTLTGQNTPASFLFRRTFFYTCSGFHEHLLYAVHVIGNICRHSFCLLQPGVKVKCSSRKKCQRLDF